MIVNQGDDDYEEPSVNRAPWLSESDADLRGINNGHHASTPPLGNEGNGTSYAASPSRAASIGSSTLGGGSMGGSSVHNPELAGFLSQAEPQSDEESGNGSGITGEDGNGFNQCNGSGGGGLGAVWQSLRGYSGLGGEHSKASGDGGAKYVQLSEQAAELRSRASAAAAGAYEQLREAEVS